MLCAHNQSAMKMHSLGSEDANDHRVTLNCIQTYLNIIYTHIRMCVGKNACAGVLSVCVRISFSFVTYEEESNKSTK